MKDKVNHDLSEKTVLKQVDWPLSSKNLHQNPKMDILAHSKEITLIVEKGTKRTTHILNPNLPIKINRKHNSAEKHVCDTCREEINSEISRVLIMRDKDGGPRLLCLHFFFPCWDLDLICQKYPNLIIDKTAFSIPENIHIKESSIKDMQQNIEFWT